MKKLEKIFAVGALVAGIGLISCGLYKEKPLLNGLGLLSLSYPVGIGMREIIEEQDRRYFERYKSFTQDL